ncbi:MULTISPECIES: aminotransferase class V-fold PLP-dependent enzyme [unclassified Sphingomonas]|uniref:cysteine desulfurase family protein n=1 Tax=unclassified Sphingomonas TaxID=196159 RepID=UPI00286A2C26|nr:MULTISPECIES: aminotransferase class V-fold PLP-dependent enzyme [unclassified Sphingomonas]
MSRLYLDHAATTPMTDAARAALAQGCAAWANPSSPHAEGRAAKRLLEDARSAIARALGWSHEILFTSGASESLSIALTRSMAERRFVGAIDHDAVLRAAPDAVVMPVGPDGVLRLPDLSGPRAVVTVQWANSETGVRQPIAELAEAIHAAGHILLVDAAQMPAGADRAVIDHADLVALSAHKRGGPPGIGALLVRNLAVLAPTGGQERGYRPGTENMPGVLGYAAALAEPEPDHTALRAYCDDAIRRSGGIVVADASHRHPAIASYHMPGKPSAAQLIQFDLAHISVSAGSACASGSLKPSHVLSALGWSEEAGREVVRVSFGRSTTREHVDRFVTAWRAIARGTRVA